MPVLGFYSLWVQLQRQRGDVREGEDRSVEASFLCWPAAAYKTGGRSQKGRSLDAYLEINLLKWLQPIRTLSRLG